MIRKLPHAATMRPPLAVVSLRISSRSRRFRAVDIYMAVCRDGTRSYQLNIASALRIASSAGSRLRRNTRFGM